MTIDFETKSPAAGLIRLSLAVAILAFGAWVSLRYSLGFWVADADMATQVVLWDGVVHHGLKFVASWRYTQDNWLFSLTPLTYVIYSLFGTNPKLVVALGWLIFIACVGMTSFIVHRISGRRAAFYMAAVLLFPSYWALGHSDFLANPVTHNISMAWALLALLLAARGIGRMSPIYIAAAALSVFIDAVSDPWAGAAIALPLITVSATLAALNRRHRQGWYAGALCAAAALAFIAARTRLFGVLDFLPLSGFTLTTLDGLVSNTVWMFRTLANMFNIVPRAHLESVPAMIFDFAALAAILIAAVILTIRDIRQAPISQQLILGVAILSIAAVGLAFLLNLWDPPTYPYVGRFFPNFYFFGAILVSWAAAQNFRRMNIIMKGALIAYGVLFIASGLASFPRMWTGQMPLRVSSVPDLATFLEKNGLTYGFGPYWGADALAMNWMTDGRVTIRPIDFLHNPDRISSERRETSTLWFLPSDKPAGSQETFLVINADGCPSVEACVATASRQFGTPSRRLTYRDRTILVWPHNIVSQIANY